jgi:hypothetical protein
MLDMTRTGFDGLVEAVRYSKSGKIEMVRLYKKRGTTFSDRVLFSRSRLKESLYQGKRYMTGIRRSYWGNSFDVDKRIILSRNTNEVIITVGQSGQRDFLANVPLF